MFIFSRSIAGPLAALAVSAMFVVLDALFTGGTHDSSSYPEAKEAGGVRITPAHCIRVERHLEILSVAPIHVAGWTCSVIPTLAPTNSSLGS